MTRRYTDIAFTDSVKAAQTRYGTRRNAQKVETWPAWETTVGPTSSSAEVRQDSSKC